MDAMIFSDGHLLELGGGGSRVPTPERRRARTGVGLEPPAPNITKRWVNSRRLSVVGRDGVQGGIYQKDHAIITRKRDELRVFFLLGYCG